MGTINILPKILSDKIAAGEVIERPASVVKELVENSLDAASTRIEIRIRDAGRAEITVIDNGLGMGAEDLQLAPLRHATSKIRVDADLQRITTFGFRGEALSSIAAVGFLTLASRSAEESCGWELTVEGGEVKGLREAPRTPGTTVTVRNLFFNTPARLKFLKSTATETAHIIRTITEFALAYPQVAFILIDNDRERLGLNPATTLLERSGALLGKELSRNFVPLSFAMPPLKISGVISRAGYGQSDRRNQYIFVNQRPVTDKTIGHALMQGYHTLLMDKQFPAIVLFIETPPELVDVNVHPNKREVRFRDSAVLHDLLVKAVKDALTGKKGLPELSVRDVSGKAETSETVPGLLREGAAPRYNVSAAQTAASAELFSVPLQHRDAPAAWDNAVPAAAAPEFLQVHSTYIISQDEPGIVIIDQHAAHERIIFDELLAQFRAAAVEKQRLLLPVTVACTPEQVVLLEEYAVLFQDLGFEVEAFGGQTFAVHAYPALMRTQDIKSVFMAVTADIAAEQISVDREQRLTQFLASIACHGAVRAHEKLSREEITSLVARLWKTAAPYTCPHGRPTIITISRHELEKRFKRK
ncbi:MAG: DNA mismatch repair endonuclease MutL [Candidatus Omnitrophica bacterium]|nr:DNA mismatch repair endonuclease MutL [Candidatus Omnitrophota bacterium]